MSRAPKGQRFAVECPQCRHVVYREVQSAFMECRNCGERFDPSLYSELVDRPYSDAGVMQ